jgi:DNA-binding NarL/FixJ family response regulator
VSVETTVLIADDHAPTRAAIHSALEGHGFVVRAECADADGAVESALRLRPEVCLLDIRMPGNGIAAAAAISAKLPETAIVMLTVSHDESDFFDALRAGASGYLLKDTDPRQLPDLVGKVIRGEGVLSPSLVARLIEEFRERGRRRRIAVGASRGVELTSREWEVLDLLRQGLSTAEIAQRLFIAQVTVRTHVASILRKLRVTDRDAALRTVSDEPDGTRDRFLG